MALEEEYSQLIERYKQVNKETPSSRLYAETVALLEHIKESLKSGELSKEEATRMMQTLLVYIQSCEKLCRGGQDIAPVDSERAQEGPLIKLGQELVQLLHGPSTGEKPSRQVQKKRKKMHKQGWMRS